MRIDPKLADVLIAKALPAVIDAVRDHPEILSGIADWIGDLFKKRPAAVIVKRRADDDGDDGGEMLPPPTTSVPPQPAAPPKLAQIHLKVQWAADTAGELRSDTDAIAMGQSALNWNCAIRFDTDTFDQYKQHMPAVPAGTPIKRNWRIRWVSPEGVELGQARIVAPDTVENTVVPVSLGTGVYDKTGGFCLKMSFKGPLSGRYVAFVSCDEDGITSNELPIAVD